MTTDGTIADATSNTIFFEMKETKLDAEEMKELLRKRQEEKRQRQERDDITFLVCLSQRFDFCTPSERKAVYQALRSAWYWSKK